MARYGDELAEAEHWFHTGEDLTPGGLCVVLDTEPVMVEHDYDDQPPGGIVLQPRVLVRAQQVEVRPERQAANPVVPLYLEDTAVTRSISPGDFVMWGGIHIGPHWVTWRPKCSGYGIIPSWGEKGYMHCRRYPEPEPLRVPVG